jgi:hypothetical protein
MRNRAESNMFVSHRCQVENKLGVYKHVCNNLFRTNADCAQGLQRREHRYERPRGAPTQIGALMVAKCPK